MVGGQGFEGSHDEDQGLDASGQLVDVPVHHHQVSLDYVRLELETQYTLQDRWDLVLRLPFDVKRQDASIALKESATRQEQQAMLRNMNLHHRDETYSGFADLMLLATHRRQGLLRAGDGMKLGFGFTIPSGRTEQNPYHLAEERRQHLHIQFGTGTYDPLVELNYHMPVTGRFSWIGYSLGRFPLYENGKTYRGPVEVISGLGLGLALGPRWYCHVNASIYYQGVARWDGVRDDNSGLVATSSFLGAKFRLSQGAHIALDLRYPISQRTLEEGDVFEHGPTLAMSFVSSFARFGN